MILGLVYLDSPSRPPLDTLPETAKMLSTTPNASLKHAAAVRARAWTEEMYSDSFRTKQRMDGTQVLGRRWHARSRRWACLQRYVRVESETP